MELCIPHGKRECRGKVSGQHPAPYLRGSVSFSEILHVLSTDFHGTGSDKCHTFLQYQCSLS